MNFHLVTCCLHRAWRARRAGTGRPEMPSRKPGGCPPGPHTVSVAPRGRGVAGHRLAEKEGGLDLGRGACVAGQGVRQKRMGLRSLLRDPSRTCLHVSPSEGPCTGNASSSINTFLSLRPRYFARITCVQVSSSAAEDTFSSLLLELRRPVSSVRSTPRSVTGSLRCFCRVRWRAPSLSFQ